MPSWVRTKKHETVPCSQVGQCLLATWKLFPYTTLFRSNNPLPWQPRYSFVHPAYIVSYTTRLLRTRQLLVQLTLKDKRCPPFLATAKIRYTRFRRPSSIAKFLHIARKRRRTHREPRQHCHFGKKLGHAKKRQDFTGSNGRRQDTTTTSETAMRRRMPCDTNSGALNLRVPSVP